MLKAIVDTNILLRYLSNDIPEQAEKVRQRLDQVKQKRLKLYLLPVTVVEALFQLIHWYQATRKDASFALIRFIEESGVITSEKENILNSLILYSNRKIDIEDLYVYYTAKAEKKRVLSFDRDFDKLDKKIRLKP